MTESNENPTPVTPKIVVRPDGSLKVFGNIPLVHKTQVVSEYGEPLTWKKDKVYETKEVYSLCRCGKSSNMPFCDSTHFEIDFDGTETAETNTFEERMEIDEKAQGMVVKKDNYLCMESGFCGNRLTNIDQMTAETAEPAKRAEIMAMIERCPAGVYTYAMSRNEPDIEPDLPMQIAITTEITADGPINGPIWVTGNIPIERSDGKPFETRNRVTLCSCGQSQKKPLCDGAHRELEQAELRKKKAQGK
jgi:CDGSH-type Zn-finger protein